uniref:Uncharacterized protein n=1 Tax=Ralstonia pickettii (strain 12D) TaxID=428406 RepID=C6BF80_RALP1
MAEEASGRPGDRADFADHNYAKTTSVVYKIYTVTV